MSFAETNNINPHDRVMLRRGTEIVTAPASLVIPDVRTSERAEILAAAGRYNMDRASDHLNSGECLFARSYPNAQRRINYNLPNSALQAPETVHVASDLNNPSYFVIHQDGGMDGSLRQWFHVKMVTTTHDDHAMLVLDNGESVSNDPISHATAVWINGGKTYVRVAGITHTVPGETRERTIYVAFNGPENLLTIHVGENYSYTAFAPQKLLGHRYILTPVSQGNGIELYFNVKTHPHWTSKFTGTHRRAQYRRLSLPTDIRQGDEVTVLADTFYHGRYIHAGQTYTYVNKMLTRRVESESLHSTEGDLVSNNDLILRDVAVMARDRSFVIGRRDSRESEALVTHLLENSSVLNTANKTKFSALDSLMINGGSSALAHLEYSVTVNVQHVARYIDHSLLVNASLSSSGGRLECVTRSTVLNTGPVKFSNDLRDVVAIGYGALNGSGRISISGPYHGAIALGTGAMANDNMVDSIAIGYRASSSALADNTDHRSNSVFIGNFAGYDADAADTVAIGHGTGINSVTETSVLLGTYAGIDSFGNDNVAIGTVAGRGGGNDSVAIGTFTQHSTSTNNTVALGKCANANVDNTIQLGWWTHNLSSFSPLYRPASQADYSVKEEKPLGLEFIKRVPVKVAQPIHTERAYLDEAKLSHVLDVSTQFKSDVPTVSVSSQTNPLYSTSSVNAARDRFEADKGQTVDAAVNRVSDFATPDNATVPQSSEREMVVIGEDLERILRIYNQNPNITRVTEDIRGNRRVEVAKEELVYPLIVAVQELAKQVSDLSSPAHIDSLVERAIARLNNRR